MRFILVVLLLAGCSKAHEEAPSGQSYPTPTSATTLRAMPFTIESVMLSDLFRDNLKVAKVNVRVNGGSEDNWMATAIAIASRVSDLGADSVEATVDRSDLNGINAAPHYWHLATVYFSKNPQHSIWDNGKQIQVLTSAHVATRDEAQRDTEFLDLNDKFIQQGMDGDLANKKAGAIIAKKYRQPANWQLATAYLTERSLPGGEINIISDDAKDSLEKLDVCMKGKIIRMLTSCE